MVALSFLPTIGLEIHAQLRTASKIFCGCSTLFGAAPNTNVCPVCLGMPGALPVLNRQAVLHAVRASLALGCTVHPASEFARKHYFYPDLPKGYQISQHARPLATDGQVVIDTPSGQTVVGIRRVHMEEDAGKSLHGADDDPSAPTAVDFNRSGVPLIEIVTAPEIDSAELAAACFSRIREVLVALGVNDGNMEEGSLRCDANVSVRPSADAPLGARTETKNLNSFRYVQRAIAFEIERQGELLSRGERIQTETRLWDATSGRTLTMRDKEEAHDYRYLPEPDLPPLMISDALLEDVRATMPELPEARRRRLIAQYGLPPYDAGVLTQSPGLAEYFEAAARASGSPKAASNWIMGETLGRLNAAGVSIADIRISPEALGRLIRLVESGRITGPIAKFVFERMFEQGGEAEAIVEAEGLARLDDDSAIDRLVQETLAANPKPVAQYRAGKTQTFGFLVGQAMKASGGKADPEKVAAAVRRILENSEL
jgi:aspartyl-tRNA(Asn)/glutamyl-tRNA(Gln) amidotransferase subunit B